MTTGFFWDEKCFWHGGSNYAFTQPVGGYVQPFASGGLPEDPETKRRLKNLLDVTGLSKELACQTATPATAEDLLRVHPQEYITSFKELSDNGGGELGLRAPFGMGGYEFATLSAGLVKGALFSVLVGDTQNAYALSRPPGHHCLPDFPNGFCLLANIAIAVEAAFAKGLTNRVAVLDWDAHHGNGTEAIFYDRDDVLTISVHQENNYPLESGAVAERGVDAGRGCNVNIPLPPGAGHATYLEAMQRLVIPALNDFGPDIIIVACGYDAAAIDPLSRMMATAQTFQDMTGMIMGAAEDLCDGRLVMAHEGGYSEVYVPFCGHAVLTQMSGSDTEAEDPFADTFEARQPNAKMQAFYSSIIDDYVELFGF
jgi:acetoin utilization deacetylase AcuC-like enzyme